MDLAILFVHGIGNQRPGDLLARMGHSCEQAISALLEGEASIDIDRLAVSPEGRDTERLMRIARDGVRPRTVLMREAVWAGAVPPPPRVRGFLMAVAQLPALMFMLFPDVRDERRSGVRVAGPVGWFLFFDVDEIGGMLRFISRFAAAIATVVLPIALLRWDMWRGVAILTVGVALLVAALMSRRANVIRHVVQAAERGDGYRAMTGVIESALDDLEKRSNRVLVVGHSQGGYLVHAVLVRRRWRSVQTFIGVGSGLRPLTLLAAMPGRRWLAVRWLACLAFLTASAIIVLWADFSVIAPAESLRWLLADSGIRATYPGLDSEAIIGPMPAPRITDAIWSSGHLLLVILAATAPILLVHVVGRILSLDRSGGDVSPLGGIEWLELTSPSDAVGRLTHPQLSAASEILVQNGGHFLLDHVGYFNKASTVPWFVADRALRLLGLPVALDVAAINEGLVERAARRRALRAWLVLGITGLSAATAAWQGGTRGEVAMHGALLLTALSIASSVVMRHHEQRDIARTLEGSPRRCRKVARAQDSRGQALGQGLLLLAMAFLFLTVGACVRQLGAGSGSAQFLAAYVVAGWGVARTCGYQPWRWLLVALSFLTTFAAYGDVVASHPALGAVHPLVVPGVAVTAFAWSMVLGSVFHVCTLISRQRLRL